MELLDKVGLADKALMLIQIAYRWSKQRVAIARGLRHESWHHALWWANFCPWPWDGWRRTKRYEGKLAEQGMTMIIVTHEMGFCSSGCQPRYLYCRWWVPWRRNTWSNLWQPSTPSSERVLGQGLQTSKRKLWVISLQFFYLVLDFLIFWKIMLELSLWNEGFLIPSKTRE